LSSAQAEARMEAAHNALKVILDKYFILQF